MFKNILKINSTLVLLIVIATIMCIICTITIILCAFLIAAYGVPTPWTLSLLLISVHIICIFVMLVISVGIWLNIYDRIGEYKKLKCRDALRNIEEAHK